MAEILAGRVALVPQGEWNRQKEYKRLDVVWYNNNSYICCKDNVGNTPGANNGYWQLLAKSGDIPFPTIQLEIGFCTDTTFDTEHIKLHNYQYYIDNGYKLTVFRKGRYKIEDANRYDKLGEGSVYAKYRYYGWKATVINETPNVEFPRNFKQNLGWSIKFLTVNNDGIVCFENGNPLTAGHIVHYRNGNICSPRGGLKGGTATNPFQKYGLAFVDLTNYIPNVTRLWEKSCVSNIAQFRGFLNGDGAYLKR